MRRSRLPLGFKLVLHHLLSVLASEDRIAYMEGPHGGKFGSHSGLRWEPVLLVLSRW